MGSRRSGRLALVAALLTCVAATAVGVTTAAATATAATAAATAPSGRGIPARTGDGGRRVLSEDFVGPGLDDARWKQYWGVPGGDPFGWFDPSHLRVAGGMLTIDGYQDPLLEDRWATGGLQLRPRHARTYGSFLVRMRFERGGGVAHVLLLWPVDQSWPPEIDFSEDNGRDRSRTYATLHFKPGDTKVGRSTRVDLTRWHTYGVRWSRGRLTYTLDGKVWARVRSSRVPDVPMVLGLQTQAWGCGQSDWEACVDERTPDHVAMQVDWIAVYSKSGR